MHLRPAVRVGLASCVNVALRALVVVGVVAPATAHAQRAPDTATLDRGDGISKLGVDVAFSSLEFPVYESALRLEVHGQHVTRSGLGIYGALPLARSFGGAEGAEDPLDLLPDDATALGNVDAGLLYVTRASRRLSLVLRGGLGIPTSSDGRDARATLLAATSPRLTDLPLAIDAWYLRLALSPLIHVDRLFLRADVGLDLGIDRDGATATDLVRLNVGGGVDLGAAALGLELVNLITLDDFGNGEEALHTLTFTLRFMGDELQPYLAVGAPLDDSRRSAVDLYVAAGVQFVP